MHFSKLEESSNFQFSLWLTLGPVYPFSNIIITLDLLNGNLHFNKNFKEAGLHIKVLEALVRALLLA